MNTPNRPLRKVTPTQQPAIPVGQLPYVNHGADTTQKADAEAVSEAVQQSEQTPEVAETHPSQGEVVGPECRTPMYDEAPASHGGDIIEDDTDAAEVVTPARPKPTPENSGDKKVKRNVTPRRDLTIFEDEPDAKRMSNRRKKTTLNKGGMFFNERDRQIVLLVAAHGWLDIYQLCDLIGGVVPNALRHSIKRLVDHGLLDNKFTGYRGQALYTATPSGLRKVGTEGFTTTFHPKSQLIEHTDAITALHVHLRNATAGNPNRIFITERELQAAATSGVLTPRVLAAAPWAAAYTDFTRWIPSTVTEKGRNAYKRPDGLLLAFRDGKAQPPVPVEVERTIKTRPDYYQQAAIMFANAANSGHLASEVFYFAPASTGTLEELSKALKSVYADPSGKFRWPANLPKVTFRVNDLDPFYTPYSATRGWIPASGAASDE